MQRSDNKLLAVAPPQTRGCGVKLRNTFLEQESREFDPRMAFDVDAASQLVLGS